MGRLLLCATALTYFAGISEVQAADEPVWHKDYSKARTIAKRLKRPLFVVFR